MNGDVGVAGLEHWPSLVRLEGRLRKAVTAVVSAHDPPFDGQVSLTFLSDERIAALNREWLGREGPTDVIAFLLPGSVPLGEVCIAPETAGRNAREHGVDVDEELVRLVVHGVLHVLGHDHPDGEERYGSPMFELQEELLRGLEDG